MIRHRGSILNRGGVCDGGGVVGYRGDYLSDGGNNLSDRGNDLSDLTDGLPVHNCVETVVGVSSILNSTLETIGVHQGVGTVHNITVAALLLSFGVTSVSVLDVVREAVLGVGIVSLNFGNGGCVCDRSGDLGYGSCGIVGRSGLDGVASVGNWG